MEHAWEINSYNILVGKPDGKRQLGRPRCRWEDNIRMDLMEPGWESVAGFIWLRIRTNGRFL
jgi:hypothetical protein